MKRIFVLIFSDPGDALFNQAIAALSLSRDRIGVALCAFDIFDKIINKPLSLC